MLRKQQQQFQIKSPCNGVVQADKLMQNLAQPIKPGSLLCTVVDSSEMRVEIEVPEWQITKITPGQIVRLHLKDWESHQFLVKIQTISNEAIKLDNHRFYLVYANIDNKSNVLKDGLSAVAHIDFTPNRGFTLVFSKFKYLSDYPTWWPN